MFLYGFAKSERDNIDDRELSGLKALAKHYLAYSDLQIATALAQSELREVMCDGEERIASTAADCQPRSMRPPWGCTASG